MVVSRPAQNMLLWLWKWWDDFTQNSSASCFAKILMLAPGRQDSLLMCPEIHLDPTLNGPLRWSVAFREVSKTAWAVVVGPMMPRPANLTGSANSGRSSALNSQPNSWGKKLSTIASSNGLNRSRQSRTILWKKFHLNDRDVVSAASCGSFIAASAYRTRETHWVQNWTFPWRSPAGLLWQT